MAAKGKPAKKAAAKSAGPKPTAFDTVCDGKKCRHGSLEAAEAHIEGERGRGVRRTEIFPVSGDPPND